MIKSLHGLRGLAAFTVIFGHLSPAGTSAALGVVLFFVLSGYLLGWLYLDRRYSAQHVVEYMTARLARVYPLFAFVVVGTAVLNKLAGAGIFGLHLRQVFPNLLLAGSNRTIWTISVEFQFYAVFIGIWFLRSRFSINIAMALLAALFVIAVIIAFIFGGSTDRINLASYLPIFMVGLLLAILLSQGLKVSNKQAAAGMPLLLAGYVYLAITASSSSVYFSPVVVLVCGGLVACAVRGPSSLAVQFLSTAPLVWLGEISFGAYMLHRHSQWLVQLVTGTHEKSWPAFAAMLALTLFLAELSRRMLEQPARARLKSLVIALAEKHAGATKIAVRDDVA